MGCLWNFCRAWHKIIIDAFKEEEDKKIECYLCFKYILLVSIATSIDALAAGASLAFSGVKS